MAGKCTTEETDYSSAVLLDTLMTPCTVGVVLLTSHIVEDGLCLCQLLFHFFIGGIKKPLHPLCLLPDQTAAT